MGASILCKIKYCEPNKRFVHKINKREVMTMRKRNINNLKQIWNIIMIRNWRRFINRVFTSK